LFFGIQLQVKLILRTTVLFLQLLQCLVGRQQVTMETRRDVIFLDKFALKSFDAVFGSLQLAHQLGTFSVEDFSAHVQSADNCVQR